MIPHMSFAALGFSLNKPARMPTATGRDPGKSRGSSAQSLLILRLQSGCKYKDFYQARLKAKPTVLSEPLNNSTIN
uniref:Uncharacterized protein n=1 Tax=Anguilla anguilla TaxID=7936 RepID=A0A0E9PR90_ANGAN